MCSVTILDVTGNTGIDTIATVNGTATGCARITLFIDCGNDNHLGPFYAPVDQSGNWSVAIQTKCVCGSPITVNAACGSDPNCMATFNGPIRCNCCPVVSTNIQPGQCYDDGTRQIEISSSFTLEGSCKTVSVYWDLGDGTITPHVSFGPFGTTTNVICPTITHTYKCGQTYNATVHVVNSSGECPPQAVPIAVACCNDCCPQLNLKYIYGNCTAQAVNLSIEYSIILSGDVSCPPIKGSLSFPGQSIAIVNSSPLNGTVALVLPPGTGYAVSLLLTDPGNCGAIHKTFDVSCDCCPNATVSFNTNVSEACNADHETKHVTISAHVTPMIKQGCPSIVQAQLLVDGAAVASGSGSGTFSLNWQGDYTCGDHSITISYPGSTCADASDSFCVSVCEKPACKANRIAFEVFATTFLISLVLAIVNTYDSFIWFIALGAAILAVISYFTWLPCPRQCNKCTLFLALWEIILAAFAGFLMLSKSTLSWLFFVLSGSVGPVFAVIIIILILLLCALIIYLLFKYWVQRCCPTNCEKWTNFQEAFLNVSFISTGIVVGILAMAGVAGFYIIPLYAAIWALISLWVWYKKIMACGW